MNESILGLHHITAIANNAQRNYDFYTHVLGLRLVKKTVNFDDPSTYHFYYGDEGGSPGTILTFFPWEGIGPGRNGIGMATEIGYSVPADSLDNWLGRFNELGVGAGELAERFGEQYLSFTDPDGLSIALIVPKQFDHRMGWETEAIKSDMALRGFHSVTLTLQKIEATARVLTDIFGYRLVAQDGNRYRFQTDAVPEASIVDLLEEPEGRAGRNAAGTNHHVAFRVANDAIQMEFREKILESGLQITPKIDRDYFFSLYFREPGGVLFEIATDNPGFTVDEPLDELGNNLKLPKQYEGSRAKIEKTLPVLKSL
ncbi:MULTISPECIES: ring-cleaving dioxygenase [unclassified Spirosoma]|uniref:ring-cleaving dioxygenase n=1 Tax=unclassified Spirosoma TaxID=2621999 RepID=UPI00095F2688|nr:MULTISPECIES: ring-cleaving dioxygenase [unclassified Spirosoma]MBN8822768.1 ring-cleaving dioxygenase [Spirosoma sp.]OJW79978.1 MAG: ring-cleaving dioxygenase [Spirosoma sp. 48-14]